MKTMMRVAIITALVSAGAAHALTSVRGGNWSDSGTWGGSVPIAAEDVIVATGHSVTVDVATASINTLTHNGTLIFTGWNNALTAAEVTLNGTVTHLIQSATVTNLYGGWTPDNRVWFVCSNLTLNASKSIDASGKGYKGGIANSQTGFGPGAGIGAAGPGGGGHGGRGGSGSAAVGGRAYGSETAPEDPGSGGGAYQDHDGDFGGGVVRIDATGRVTVHGTVSVNGANVTSAGGGGAGGSVWITCHTFAGSGWITADGVEGAPDHHRCGGGGGGRIAIHYDTEAQAEEVTPTVRIRAAGGRGGTSYTITESRTALGGPGSIYLSDAGFFPTANLQGGALVIPGFASWSVAALTISNGVAAFPPGFALTVAGSVSAGGSAGLSLSNATLAVGGDLLLDTDVKGGSFLTGGPDSSYSVAGDLRVRNGWLELIGVSNAPLLAVGGNLMLTNAAVVGGYLYIFAAATNGLAPGYGARVSVTGSLVVASSARLFPYAHEENGGAPRFEAANLYVLSGGAIDANAKGFRGGKTRSEAGFGPGRSLAANDTGSGGAGHGGAGGGSSSAGGSTYGSLTEPPLPGRDSGWVNAVAPWGGGLVHVTASDRIVIDGTVSANGADHDNRSGGGAGGGIYLSSKTFRGTGSVTAQGGIGGTSNGGGGGGGRIAIHYNAGEQAAVSPKPSVLLSAQPGRSRTTTSTDGTPGTLYLTDTNFYPTATLRGGGQIRIPGVSEWFFDSLMVTNAWVDFDVPLTVAGDMTVMGLTARMDVYAAALNVGGRLTVNQGRMTILRKEVNAGALTVTNAASLFIYARATNGLPDDVGARLSVAGAMLVTTNSWIYPYSDTTNGGSVKLEVGSLDVRPGGGFNADAKGFRGGNAGDTHGRGPGRSLADGTGTGGAGYGGAGGNAVTAGGVAYGDAAAPKLPGSGSGYANTPAASGGGLIWVEAGGTLRVDGTLTANGENYSNRSGGGSGGGIHLRGRSFSGGGTLRANGGSVVGGWHGGGGGGGRIAVWAVTHYPFTGTTNVAFGVGHASAAPGKVGTVVFGTLPSAGTVLLLR